MYDRPLTIEQNLTMLAATPARIADLTEGLSPALLLTPPEPNSWSARDVLAHLRACADMWGNYIGKILSVAIKYSDDTLRCRHCYHISSL